MGDHASDVRQETVERKSKILGRRWYTDPKTGTTFETYALKNKQEKQHLICHERVWLAYKILDLEALASEIVQS